MSTKRAETDDKMDVNFEVAERADRDVPDRRRVLLGRELHRPGADLAKQPVRSRAAAHAAGAALQPPPALSAAVPGPLLPRHQLDVRLQPLQAGPVSLLLHPQLEGRQPHLGLSAGRGPASPAHLQAGAGRHRHQLVRIRRRALRHAHHRRPHHQQQHRQPVPLGITSSVRATILVRLAQRPHVPQPRLVQHHLGRDRRSERHPLGEHLQPLRGGDPLLLSALGSVHLPRQAGGRSDREPRSARRADLRALLHGRHLQHPRLRAAVAGAGHPLAVDAGARRLAQHLPGRRQRAGHRQRRDRVPHLRQGRHPRRRVRRRRQCLQPGRPVLQAGAVQRRRQQEPLHGPLDISAYRASWGFGFRWFSPIGPLRFEWGIPFWTLPGEQPIVFEFTIGNFF